MAEPIELSVDGTPVEIGSGATVLDACRVAGVDVPTLCWAPNLAPVNVCRLCVVEVEGSRPLVPACSRPAEAGMVVRTASERVHTSRRMVLELLASTVDLSQSDELPALVDEYGADPGRHHALIDGAARVDRPVKVEDDLYVRDYDQCVLCYKCVEACGDQAQHTFAIAVAGRGFDAGISTEFDVTLPDSACVYCGNCIAVCPTGALQGKVEFDMRAAGDWRPDDQDVTTTVCSYCGVGCNLELRTQDGHIVDVTSPVDHAVSSGHLCVKGRFGWQYVAPPQARDGSVAD